VGSCLSVYLDRSHHLDSPQRRALELDAGGKRWHWRSLSEEASPRSQWRVVVLRADIESSACRLSLFWWLCLSEVQLRRRLCRGPPPRASAGMPLPRQSLAWPPLLGLRLRHCITELQTSAQRNTLRRTVSSHIKLLFSPQSCSPHYNLIDLR
jgi:hypothetical protein